MQAGTRSQLQLAAVCSKQAATVCSKQAATLCSKQAATKSEKSNMHTKNAQAARLQQTMSRMVAATKSRKVAATKSRKVAATKSSKTNLHTKNSQAATMPQLAAAAKPHACCLFAAIHCKKPFISIRVVSFTDIASSKAIILCQQSFCTVLTPSTAQVGNLVLPQCNVCKYLSQGMAKHFVLVVVHGPLTQFRSYLTWPGHT